MRESRDRGKHPVMVRLESELIPMIDNAGVIVTGNESRQDAMAYIIKDWLGAFYSDPEQRARAIEAGVDPDAAIEILKSIRASKIKRFQAMTEEPST